MLIMSIIITKKGIIKPTSGEDNGMFGKTHSKEAKKQMSLKRKGVPKSKKHLESMRASSKGRVHINKDGIRKFVKKEELKNYKDWNIGTI